MLILGQVAILSGVHQYNEKYTTETSPLGIINIIMFFALLVVFEIYFQIYKYRKPSAFRNPNLTMTLEDFNKQVTLEGKKLVILDDLILEVGDYMDNHPGGKFLIEHNIGRDISKFFYGGYGLDGNMLASGSLKNTHSNIARAQVDTLIVARLVGSKAED